MRFTTQFLLQLNRLVVRWLGRTCLVFVVGVVPAQAANKCTSAEGKVTFSDLPCASNERSTKLKSHMSESDPAVTGTEASGSDATGSTTVAMQAWIQAENMLKEPQFRGECQALTQRIIAFELEKPGQQTPAAQVMKVKSQAQARCFAPLRAYLDASKKMLDEQDRIDAAKSAESARVYCERRKTFIATERARLKREPQDNTRGLEWIEEEYKIQCNAERARG